MTAATEQTQFECLIEQLASALRLHLPPAIPLSVDQWSSAQCAAYFKCSLWTFRKDYAALEDFPRARQRRTKRGHLSQPLWPASEVIAWWEREEHAPPKRPGRPRKTRVTTTAKTTAIPQDAPE
jgi:hypothetical protein